MWALIVLLMQEDGVTLLLRKVTWCAQGRAGGTGVVCPGSRAWRGNHVQGLDTGSCIPEELRGETGGDRQ